MNKNNNTKVDSEKLISDAAKQLGKNPEDFKNTLDNGALKKMIGNLSAEQSNQLNKALSDKEYAKKLLSTPQAQALIKKLSKNK